MSMFWTTLLSSLILTASTGTALGAALGLTGLIILYYFADGATSLAINAVWNILNEFTLSAIPLFIIMGEIILESGVSKKIYNSKNVSDISVEDVLQAAKQFVNF